MSDAKLLKNDGITKYIRIIFGTLFVDRVEDIE
jgi:hypothetical protein